jgi:predicted ATPase
LAAPVQAWRVVRPSAVESRFEAFHAAALTPLVGRGKELRLLLRLWERAKGGEGQVVLLSGEPGIGKSRLIAALQERSQREPHTRLRYFCSPHHQDSALHPIIAQLERAAGFERDDDPAVKLDKLAALLARTAATGEDVALVAELLSLPVPSADAVALNLGPQQKKGRTFATLARQLDGLARQAPVLMLFEDAHWVDPSSHELLDGIVGRAARLRMLLVVTFRPEFRSPWAGSHVTTLPLNRLDRQDGEALVAQVLGGEVSSLPSGLVDEIVDRTDGVPLFLEELTKAVLEAGAGGAAMAETARAAPAALAIPATLHASLMARLDRLGAAAKEVAQIGAALGREFSHGSSVPSRPRATGHWTSSLAGSSALG